ncbi:uncharacterized protein DUF4235 [Isoptericola sp. CG 20/1183]|uniref:Uncharacterized protein DUF4235 n=1 Tax=Isoptericola halotolerans TaxID=300560 RepID=A0ABX5ED63_9MICO|nr:MULTISPECIES: DUF4235 domain-containing protein [Isoptericola]PRZ03094.1 uncharacterized protein DUF4235 [Isoptericola sp. CG 20/1183]PRZ03348.1 uncharacterized protein DUF4235 [Isoptericola halotolerans]
MEHSQLSEPSEPSLGLKIGTVAATFAAGWVAQKLIKVIWEKATGSDAPIDLDADDIPIVQAITFAAVTGGVAVLARRLARQGVTKAVDKRAKHVSVV